MNGLLKMQRAPSSHLSLSLRFFSPFSKYIRRRPDGSVDGTRPRFIGSCALARSEDLPRNWTTRMEFFNNAKLVSNSFPILYFVFPVSYTISQK
jgi:hypothetical protein